MQAFAPHPHLCRSGALHPFTPSPLTLSYLPHTLSVVVLPHLPHLECLQGKTVTGIALMLKTQGMLPTPPPGAQVGSIMLCSGIYVQQA